jgi:CheY-like chemotaxis protein
MESKTPKKILIVDDDPRWLSYLTDLLYHPQHPFIIKTAESGEEALSRIFDVDLVITDVQMPTMDGLSLLKRIKQARPELPVILQTAGYAKEKLDDRLCSQMGLAGFLLKHETDSRLWPLVMNLLGN